MPENALRFQAWIYGVLGATIAGWGTLIAFWAWYPFRIRERWAWNGLALSVGIWFTADTLISVMFGVVFNVLVNAIALILLVLPLLFTKKYFIK